jgi:opacity protein-like surface antigen
MIRSKFVLLSLACLTVAVCAQRSVAADEQFQGEQFQGENPSETRWLTPESPHTQESWLCRPISAGLFVGMISGSPLIDDWVGQKQGLFGGLQLGYDGGDHWGTEFRLGFSSIELTDSVRARAEAGVGSGPTTRYADLFLWDIGLLYYPCGDTAWRPYAKVGLGTGRIRFTDALHTRYNKISGAMPLALGLKYRCNDWMALRFECADNIVFGRGSVLSVHNFSITGGVEIRFGRSRKTYWPWNPDRSLL